MDSNLKRGGTPDMPRMLTPSDSLTARFFNPAPSNFAKPNNVFERLYSESNIRRKNLEIKQKPPSGRLTTRNRPQGSEPIEMSLLRRHRESQAKMNVVRARYQAEEDRELKPVPEINAFSKAIAIHKAGLVVDRDRPPSMGSQTDRPRMKHPTYSINL